MVVSILILKCTSPLLATELGSHVCPIQCNLPLFQGEISGDLPAITSLLWRDRIEHAPTFTIFELIENLKSHVEDHSVPFSFISIGEQTFLWPWKECSHPAPIESKWTPARLYFCQCAVIFPYLTYILWQSAVS
ncbi:Uncharacterised protein [Sphingobacterium daejeonense]|nr:Uncharacterised protein [Sphingobacterium daejeonense]